MQPSSNLLHEKANVNNIIQCLEGSLQVLLSTKSHADVKKAIYLHSAMILYFKKLQGLLSLPDAEKVLNDRGGEPLDATGVTKRSDLWYWINDFLPALQTEADKLQEQAKETYHTLMDKGTIAMIVFSGCSGVLTYATLPAIMMQVIFAIYILAIICMIIMTVKICMSPSYKSTDYASLSSVSKKDIIEYAAKKSTQCVLDEQDAELSELDFLSENNIYNKSCFLLFFAQLGEEKLLSDELGNCFKNS